MLILWPLLLPVALASGWYLGRNQQNRKISERTSAFSREYFVGLNYLLDEQTDKAVDVFIKLLEVDSDTVETHLALGALFRRRGEVDRAIRIHQNVIARPQLSYQQRSEALLALGRDYMSAGVLDRAERIFHEIVNSGGDQVSQGLQHLLDIYQQEKAWEQAITVVRKLELSCNKNMQQVIAHHYCELAEEALGTNQAGQANVFLKKAFSVDRNSVRASLLQAKMYAEQGEYKAAIRAYKRIKLQDPDFISEAIPVLVDCYEKSGNAADCLAYLHETLEKYPRISVILHLADGLKKSKGMSFADDFITAQLSQNPSVRGLSELVSWHIETASGKVKEKLCVLYDVLMQILENSPIYLCKNCGFGSKKLHWYCPGCKTWGAIKPVHGLEGD